MPGAASAVSVIITSWDRVTGLPHRLGASYVIGVKILRLLSPSTPKAAETSTCISSGVDSGCGLGGRWRYRMWVIFGGEAPHGLSTLGLR